MHRIRGVIYLAFTVAVCAPSALAGPLATAPGVYFDGLVTWHGSTPFQGYYDPPANTLPSGLSGAIDWAVWLPGDFPVGFLGYVPTPGEVVYAYQLHETGLAPLTQNIVFTINDADNIGFFTGNAGFGDMTGIDPDFMELLLNDSAQWTFFAGILTGQSSSGLVFSSPFLPEMSGSVQIDDGTFAFSAVPAPGAVRVPEPSAVIIASCGLAGFGLYLLRRRALAAGVRIGSK